jgi:hypothetical protein
MALERSEHAERDAGSFAYDEFSFDDCGARMADHTLVAISPPLGNFGIILHARSRQLAFADKIVQSTLAAVTSLTGSSSARNDDVILTVHLIRRCGPGSHTQ